MEDLIKALGEMGCDMKSTLSRFLDDREFYAECFCEMLQDDGFSRLKTALEAGDVKDAFAIAHMLKGIIANMGISSMFDIMVRLVEPLRGGQVEGLMPIYEELMEDKKRYDALASKCGL